MPVKKKAAKKSVKRKAAKKSVQKKTAKKTTTRKTAKKWSARVTRESDALDLQSKIFKQKDPGKIARSLKRSAERSKRRKGTPYQSAMSMLNFYVNRGGSNLPARQKAVLEKAKTSLRKLFQRE